MGDEQAPKKISFGFSKLLKKPISAPVKPPEEKVQFIDCLEGKSIKLRDGEEVDEKKPLVIPLKEKDRTSTAAVLARIAKEVEPDLQPSTSDEPVNVGSEVQQLPAVVPENETLEARAARELLEEARKVKTQEAKTSTLVVPVADSVKITGEKESTLEDYENIPVGDFGMAMLRGMGWQEGKGIGKSNKNVDLVLPKLRPKGMGLGADKVAIAPVKTDKSNGAANQEELKIIKGSFVKIVAGKHSGSYGQVSGFDEDSARLILKAAIGGLNINLSEFMVQAVTKEEYSKQSKVINAAKFEEYKMKEMSIDVKKEKNRRNDRDSEDERNDSPNDRNRDDNRSRRDRDYDRRQDNRVDAYEHSRSRQAYDSKSAPKRYENRSSDDEDDYDRSRERRDRPEERRRRHDDSSSSDEEPPQARRRDSDKKRKGKKKRRDRSRSKKRKDRSRSRDKRRR